jgi:prepilin-type N-terminal cleavage/methylation domain-containing protein
MPPCKTTSSGFTVIELLIVIAIIGLLAATIIPRLHSASEEGIATKLQTELTVVGKRASIEESKSLTYDIVCGTGGFSQADSITAQIAVIEEFSGETVTCNSKVDGYAVSVPVGDAHYCVDSAGQRKDIPNALTPAQFVCP